MEELLCRCPRQGCHVDWPCCCVSILAQLMQYLTTFYSYAGASPAAVRRKYFSMTYYTVRKVSFRLLRFHD
jgi:hypothetical protein